MACQEFQVAEVQVDLLVDLVYLDYLVQSVRMAPMDNVVKRVCLDYRVLKVLQDLMVEMHPRENVVQWVSLVHPFQVSQDYQDYQATMLHLVGRVNKVWLVHVDLLVTHLTQFAADLDYLEAKEIVVNPDVLAEIAYLDYLVIKETQDSLVFHVFLASTEERERKAWQEYQG